MDKHSCAASLLAVLLLLLGSLVALVLLLDEDWIDEECGDDDE